MQNGELKFAPFDIEARDTSEKACSGRRDVFPFGHELGNTGREASCKTEGTVREPLAANSPFAWFREDYSRSQRIRTS